MVNLRGIWEEMKVLKDENMELREAVQVCCASSKVFDSLLHITHHIRLKMVTNFFITPLLHTL